jgi:hypothetical protein
VWHCSRNRAIHDVITGKGALVMRLSIIDTTIVLATAAAAAAQDNRIEFNLGGGFTSTTGAIENHLGHGGNFDFGVTVLPVSVFGGSVTT